MVVNLLMLDYVHQQVVIFATGFCLRLRRGHHLILLNLSSYNLHRRRLSTVDKLQGNAAIDVVLWLVRRFVVTRCVLCLREHLSHLAL